jgi:FkbM family methyltransferase
MHTGRLAGRQRSVSRNGLGTGQCRRNPHCNHRRPEIGHSGPLESRPLRRCNGLFPLAKLLANHGTIRADPPNFANEQSGQGRNQTVLFLFRKPQGTGYERRMDFLTEILRPERPTAVVDVGANPIDGDPPYKTMLAAGLCEVTGFEPQDTALERLEQKKGPRERYLPYALGDGTERTLHVCELEGMTSLLIPDPDRLALFNLFPTWGTVKKRIPIATRKLDDIAEITALDFLKMDIQGAEREVLAHGQAKLKHTVVIQTEVSFVPLYKDQPAFGDMDLALRALGFLPHSVTGTKIWPLSPMVVGNEPNRGIRQLLETDMVYVRDFTRPDAMSAEQWKHLALVAHHCYGSYDLVLKAILTLMQLGAVPADANRRYLAGLPARKAN